MVIIDEADHLNPTSTQPALRGFIEEFSNNCGFIFTCNFPGKIITPIHSRASVIRFDIKKKDRPALAKQFFVRVGEILDTEGISYDSKVVAEFIKKHFPDFRRVLNELQFYSASGKIDTGILAQIEDVNLAELIKALKEQNFDKMREWVALNVDSDPTAIFRKIYDALYEHVKKSAIPGAVVLINDYSYKGAFVADPEVNLVAMLTELMVELKGEFQ